MTERWVNEHGDEVVVGPSEPGADGSHGFTVELEPERTDLAPWHSEHEEFGAAAETAAWLMVDVIGGATWRRTHQSDWRDEPPGEHRDQQQRIAEAQRRLFGGRA